MLASIQSFLSSGSAALIATKVVAFVAFVSWVLTGVGALLSAIGDKTPGWLGSLIGALGTITHFINGLTPAASVAASPTPPVKS